MRLRESREGVAGGSVVLLAEAPVVGRRSVVQAERGAVEHGELVRQAVLLGSQEARDVVADVLARFGRARLLTKQGDQRVRPEDLVFVRHDAFPGHVHPGADDALEVFVFTAVELHLGDVP